MMIPEKWIGTLTQGVPRREINPAWASYVEDLCEKQAKAIREMRDRAQSALRREEFSIAQTMVDFTAIFAIGANVLASEEYLTQHKLTREPD